MIEFLTKFIEKYYVDPIKLGTGYNFVNSTTYALLFIAAVYGIFLFLKRSKIPIDKRFVLAIFPYAIAGSFFRVLEDANIISSYLLVTPSIYFIIVSLIFVLIVISRFIEKKFKIPYFKTMFLIAILFLLYPVSVLNFKNFYGFFLTLLFILPWIISFYIIRWKTENKLVSSTHIFDATVSVVAIKSFNFFEQYPIPRFLTSVNPLLYIITKAVVVIGVLIFIDRFSDDKEFNSYIKLIIAILGFSPGLRNLLSSLVLT
jgi:uncharacterized membrane protein